MPIKPQPKNANDIGTYGNPQETSHAASQPNAGGIETKSFDSDSSKAPAPTKMATQTSVEALIASMPDDAAKKALSGGKFSDALNLSTSVDEQNKVVEAFILTACDSNKWKGNGVTWDKILPAKDLVLKVFRETGLTEAEDPFIGFINGYCKKNSGSSLTKPMMTMLNNDYADDTLSFDDIAGTGVDGTDHVIFNKDLYGKPQDDVEYIVNAYQWLSYASNVSRINADALSELKADGSIYKNLSPLLQGIKDKKVSDPKAVRDAIIYENGKPNGKINTKHDIESAMSLAGRPNSSDGRNYTPVDRAKNALKGVTTTDDKKSIISYIINSDKSLSSDPNYKGISGK